MIRWKSIVVGAVAFLSCHAIEVVAWPSFDPAGAYKPWFLNSARAVALTAVWLTTAAAIEGAAAASDWRTSINRGINVALGAFAAMVVVILAAGPGTIFPIALAFGAGIAAASSIAGSLVGGGLTHRLRAGRK